MLFGNVILCASLTHRRAHRLRRLPSVCGHGPGSASCRWSAAGPGSGRSSRSPTPPRRRSRRSAMARLASTTSWTTTPPGRGVAAVPGQGRGREAAAARARLARAAARRRVRRGPDDHLARVLEREGEEGARLGAVVCELAGGVPCLGQRMRRARPGTGRCCPPSQRDDRFRGRRGGRRAGRVPRPDPGPPGGDHDHRSEGVPDDRGVAAGHQLPGVGAGATGDVRG